MLRRPPIRLRVTLAFALAMALVLTAIGAFVYVRFAAELDAAIDSGLRSRATDVAALVEAGRRRPRPTARESRRSRRELCRGSRSRGARARLDLLDWRPRTAHAVGVAARAARAGLPRPRSAARPAGRLSPARGAGVERRPLAGGGRRNVDRAPRRGSRRPASAAPDRRAGRARPRVAGRLRRGGRRPATGRGDARKGGGDLQRGARPAPSRAADRRRDRTAGQDAQRDAGEARRRAGTRACLRRRRGP